MRLEEILTQEDDVFIGEFKCQFCSHTRYYQTTKKAIDNLKCDNCLESTNSAFGKPIWEILLKRGCQK